MNKVTITLFTAPGCPHSEAGRTFLRRRGVSFVERPFDTDATAMPDVLFLTGRAETPVLVGGYHGAVGFDPIRWGQILDHVRAVEREDPLRLPPDLAPLHPVR